MKIQQVLSLIGLTGALALSSVAFAAKANDATFTPAQQKQMETVIHDYLVNNPQVLVEASQKLQQQQDQQMKTIEERAQAAIPKLAKDLFNAPGSPVTGNPKGTITVVEFFDYQCPHCKNMTPIVDGLVAKDKTLKIIYKEFPIFGETSVFASKAALAANQQGKYKPFHDALMESGNPLTHEKVMEAAKKAGLDTKKMTADMDSPAIQAELDSNLKLAQGLGLLGTPAFVVVDTKTAGSDKSKSLFIPGGFTAQTGASIIEQIRTGKVSG